MQKNIYFYKLLTVFALQWNHAGADYDCLCNFKHNEQAGIYATPDDQKGAPIDYMYANDCKPTYGPTVNGFNGIAFEHQVAYVKVDNRVMSQLCPGDIPYSDKVTATVATTTTAPITQPITTITTTPATTTITTTPKPTTITTISKATTVTTPPKPTTVTVTTTPKATTVTTTTKTATFTTTPNPAPTTAITTATTTHRPTSVTTTPATTIIKTTTTPTTAATTTIPTTTSTPSPTTSSIYKSSTPTHGTSTTTLPPTTTLPYVPGNTHLCQSVHSQHATNQHNMLAQHGEYCYELMTHSKVTWEHARALCTSGNGHLVSITSAEQQAFLNGFLQRYSATHAVWIGLHDTNVEGHFEWTSGAPVNYTNWTPGHVDNFLDHTREDCVAMIPYQDGVWDDIPCGRTGTMFQELGETHYMMCQSRAQTSMPPTSGPIVQTTQVQGLLDGNTKLCPSSNVQHAITHHNIMAQYGSHCYELMPHSKVSWLHAESLCNSGRGHLLYIGSAATQAFIESFLKRHIPTHAVWIGLHDRISEQHFQWTTGDPVRYTNWLPGHTDNFGPHQIEDCVELIPYKGGRWDDIPCGDIGIFMGDIGESHYVICQYDFDCICNYMNEVRAGIYASPDDQKGAPIDYLDENECRPTYGPIVNGFNGIAFQHQVAYVKVNNRVVSQLCPGNVPDSDKVTTAPVTTSPRPTTRTTTTVTTTTATTTTTPKPTTTTTTPKPTTTTATTTATTTPVPTKLTTHSPTTTITTTDSTTTPTPTTTVTTTPSTTTTTASTTTIMPTTTPTYVFPGNTHLCQSMHSQHASSHQNILAQHGEYCYELMTYTKVTWEHAEALCTSENGHLVSITSAREQAFAMDFLQRYSPTSAIWIGLHDTNVESHFEWTNGAPVNYTNWLPGHVSNFMDHSREDCVVLVPYKDGQWDDIPCGTHSFFGDVGETHYMMCQFRIGTAAKPTSSPIVQTTQFLTGTDGNTNVCLDSNAQHAIINGNVMAQYGSHCYELMPRAKVTWTHAESLCTSSRGHLLHIGSAATQTFIESFLQRHMPTKAVWIGLHDRNTEQHFEWTTGDPVQYTNWLPGHTDNFQGHEEEDCVALIPYKGGMWDDIPCGSTGLFIGDIRETHYVICQYDTVSGAVLIG